jgi:[FeFe] hydrogenase H-cluster maturation GTPase HydF
LAPRGQRLHIGLFGRRNVGKSSVFNRLLRQDAAIVSAVAGTTTDPVERAVEIQPIGPVQCIDTAGIDDDGALGADRVARTRRTIARTDLALLVTDAWGAFEDGLLRLFAERGVPCIVVANKADVRSSRALENRAAAAGAGRIVTLSAVTGEGIDRLLKVMVEAAPEGSIDPPAIAGDLVRAGDLAVLVVPIDKEAPKGRLILPQVQTIRDLLDHDAAVVVVKERELAPVLRRLGRPPALVVTDSQAFLKVAADVPPEVPLTSFSILFARYRGDLAELARGAATVETLAPGDRVLVAEACTHHPIGDDIGTVKIPRWIEQYVGGRLLWTHAAGRDFPEDVAGFRLAVHCGACMLNRRETLSRIAQARAAGVPVTNYGLAIAACLGVLERALGPFPCALDAYRQARAAATCRRGAMRGCW